LRGSFTAAARPRVPEAAIASSNPRRDQCVSIIAYLTCWQRCRCVATESTTIAMFPSTSDAADTELDGWMWIVSPNFSRAFVEQRLRVRLR